MDERPAVVGHNVAKYMQAARAKLIWPVASALSEPALCLWSLLNSGGSILKPADSAKRKPRSRKRRSNQRAKNTADGSLVQRSEEG